MIDVVPPRERVVLVTAPRKGSPDAQKIDEHLHELAELVDTAGAEVVGQLSQQLAAPNPGTLIGEGKVEELKALIGATGATLVAFDEELTPAQGQALEEGLATRVMDRAEVILDIFATRARTHEARLQVELAQLQYLLPRLTRMWSHLSRIRGGIGLRGPGETQLETDRRIIRTKIALLNEKLQDVARHRETIRSGRNPMFSVALTGYTNAGKSSIMRALSGEHDILVENRLFATLDTLTREVNLGDTLRVRISDTVGFIRKLPHHLVASFRATLAAASEADLLLLVTDAAHPEWEDHLTTVREVLAELGLAERPALLVFNKLDAVEDPAAFAARVRDRYPDAIFTTTMRTDGLAPLKAELRGRAEAVRPVVRVLLDPADGRLLSQLYRVGDVLAQGLEGDRLAITVRLEPWRAEQLRRDGLHIEQGEADG
ncbi:MAG TPA: GTPase HflX [Gemmatimonadales bacterium]|jgi:GTP-binding protein HflX|nr:GTPase HflX [Gemmatimonadales bacterium]